MMLSQYAQALEDARTSVNLDSGFVKGYVRIAKCCVTLGDAVSANQALNKAAEVDANNASVAAERANVLTLEKFAQEARSAYEAQEYRKVRRTLTILFCHFLKKIFFLHIRK